LNEAFSPKEQTFRQVTTSPQIQMSDISYLEDLHQ
jgi:hypothetical protein